MGDPAPRAQVTGQVTALATLGNEEKAILSSFRNYLSDENHDLCLSICGNYHTHKVEGIHYRHAKHNDVITMFDIIKFHTKKIYWII